MSTQSPAQLAAKKRYREKNRELLREKSREYHKKNPQSYKPHPLGYLRNYHYKTKYGITMDEYTLMLEAQDYRCAICGEAETTKNKQGQIASLCVDHNHVTNKVRGLLCRMCNSALGKFKDSIEILDKAKSYLNQHGNSIEHQDTQ